MLGLAAAMPAGAVDEVAPVLDCMRKNAPVRTRVHSLTLEHTDAEGKIQTLKGRLWVHREKAAGGAARLAVLLRLNAPREAKGTAFLVTSTGAESLTEGMHLYLPAFGKVRKVTGSVADGSMFGTNFTYSDFRQIVGAFEGFKVTPDSGGPVRERPTHVLRFTAPAEPGLPVHSVKMWVDQKSCVPGWAEFYEGSTLRKQLSTGERSLEQAPEDHWFRSEVTMSDLRDASITVLKLDDTKLLDQVSPKLFDAGTFHLD